MEVIETIPGYGYIYCLDCEFAFPSEEELQEADLIQRWNARTEPTCNAIYIGDCVEVAGVWYSHRCSVCGEYIDDSDTYCKGCRAKVME